MSVPKVTEGSGGREGRRNAENAPLPLPQATEGGLLRHLNVVVLGAGHHQVVLAGRLGDRQTHHRADVASQLADGLKPAGGERPANGGRWIRGSPGLWRQRRGEGVYPRMNRSGQGTLPPPSKQDEGSRHKLPWVAGISGNTIPVSQSRDGSPAAWGSASPEVCSARS